MSLTTDDHIAIQQLYARYNHAIDLGDSDGWAATFTEDGTFESGPMNFEGREALAGFAKGFASQMKARHWTNNLVVDGDGANATGACYLVLLDLSEKPPAMRTTGIYRDQLVKSGGGWRFKSRKVEADS